MIEMYIHTFNIPGTYVYVSVKRMKTGGRRTTFPNIDLLSVDVPEAVEHLYSLPSVFSEKEAASYPLFDKSGKVFLFVLYE